MSAQSGEEDPSLRLLCLQQSLRGRVPRDLTDRQRGVWLRQAGPAPAGRRGLRRQDLQEEPGVQPA